MATATKSVRRGVAADAEELDILGSVKRGRVALPGGELRCALARELELLGVLGDLEEQGLIAGELRFRLTGDGRARLAELVARRREG